MTEKGKHLCLDDRKMISSCLSHGKKLVEIAAYIGKDPRTISKEILKNRIFETPPDLTRICPRLMRFPYVCATCPKKLRRSDCVLQRASYDAEAAQNAYNLRLKESRQGPDMTPNDRIYLTNVIRDGLNTKESIYSITQRVKLGKSSTTIYRYIHSGYIGIKPSDLPLALKYKKRKRRDTSYIYQNTNIDRNGRTYPSYLFYKKSHPNEMITQMDFLGNTKFDRSKILVISIPDLEFPILRLIEKPDQQKVEAVLDDLEYNLGRDLFKKIFPLILTDRDPCFSDFEKLEKADEFGEIRTLVYYCDPYCSSQKGHVENINKMLRKFFPKGQTINHFNEEKIAEINNMICSYKLRSLNGYSPKECFVSIYNEEIYNILINKR